MVSVIFSIFLSIICVQYGKGYGWLSLALTNFLRNYFNMNLLVPNYHYAWSNICDSLFFSVCMEMSKLVNNDLKGLSQFSLVDKFLWRPSLIAAYTRKCFQVYCYTPFIVVNWSCCSCVSLETSMLMLILGMSYYKYSVYNICFPD